MIRVIKMNFGRCYLINNELAGIRYGYLVDTPTHPSFREVVRIWFNPADDKSYYENHRVGMMRIQPPWRFRGYGSKSYDQKDKEFIHREFPEMYL